MESPDLRQFADYRAFLIAHVDDCKKRRPDWTYGMFARQLGLQDPSSITKIIQGQREPGPTITGKLIQYFKFSGKDAQYFLDLVQLRKLKNDPKLAAMILEKLHQARSASSQVLLEDKTYQMISKWYYVLILEMARLDRFVEDGKWIAKQSQFKVTPTDAERAIQVMLDLGLLTRVNGKLTVRDVLYSTPHDVPNEAVKRHHESMLDHAKTALYQFATHEREFSSIGLAMSSEDLPQAKAMIREFKKAFTKTFLRREHGDIVHQFQMQLFPLCKSTKGNPKS